MSESNLEEWKARDKAIHKNAINLYNILERHLGITERILSNADGHETAELMLERDVLHDDMKQLMREIETEGQM